MNRPELARLSSEAPTLDLEMNVSQRLVDLRLWATDWEAEDDRLRQRIENLNPNFRADVLLGSQISSLRRHLACRIVRQPIYLDPARVRGVGLGILRQQLASQYACLSQQDRQLWLTNLFFLLTPTLRALIEKLDTIRQYRSLGQARCLLLGGVSGTGKSSFLSWYAANHLPNVQPARNHVPVIKIDAPVSNRSPKPLFQRMILACGATIMRGDEEHYLQLLELFFQQCGVELLIVDEIEHMTQQHIRRRLLELSNLTSVPIVCASCNPIAWTAGDTEVQGRWNDYFELSQFTGPRLDAFLTLLELLLPFDQDSHLGVRAITDPQSRAQVTGPAHYIEQWTDGILREIMVLVMDASFKALDAGQPCLTVDILSRAWRDIKRAKVVNFLDYLRAQHGGIHV
jgi:hypothetical protein